MRNFRDLEVWQDSKKLVETVCNLIEVLPQSERFGLKSQISRYVVSIPANITEGCAKDSHKDFVRYLQISMGSAFELDQTLVAEIHKMQKRINLLIKYSKINY